MLWLALHLRALPLEALQAASLTPGYQDDARRTPWVVIEERKLVAADGVAREQGVQIGMSLAAASSLLPELQWVERNRKQEAALIERLALALTRYTPLVVRRDDSVLLEVSATRRLFGGGRALLQQAQQTVADCGIQEASWAVAPTAGAAWLLARVVNATQTPPLTRSTEARLDALPLSPVLAAWRQEAALVELLQGIGCQTLGEARALPRTGLKRRGAAAFLDLVDRAYAQAPDPQAWYEPPAHFEAKLELMHRIDDAAALVFAAQRLVHPLAGWLTQRWLAATRVSLVLDHETLRRRQIPHTVVDLVLGEPTRDAAQITLLLRERLQRLTLPSPAYALLLRLDESVSHAGRPRAFWRQADAQREGESGLIDRLLARLGPQGVQRAQRCADHRPEKAMRWVHPHDVALREATHPARAGEAPRQPWRPTWLLAEPQALRENAHSPLLDDVPLTLLTQAERIEAGWFDGALVRRDYHVAMKAEGHDRRGLWIFQERRRGEPARWFLHGIFG